MDFLNAHTEPIGFWAGGTGVGLWLLYGYLRMSAPLMVANALTGAQILFIAALKIWRRK
jgi:uncharacterized protein with PQ loop repeat